VCLRYVDVNKAATRDTASESTRAEIKLFYNDGLPEQSVPRIRSKAELQLVKILMQMQSFCSTTEHRDVTTPALLLYLTVNVQFNQSSVSHIFNVA